MLLPTLFIAGFLAAAAAPVVVRASRSAAGWILAAVPAALAVAVLLELPMDAEAPPTAVLRWVPALELDLALRLDGLAALFVLLVTGVGAMVCVYAGGYLREHRHLGRFYSFLLLFMGAMVGIVLADHLLFLYVCWELTTITSWLLIGFEHEKSEGRSAAWQALIVTTAGGLAMLAGFVLLGQTAGTYRISELLELGDVVRASELYVPILALVLAGAATKSALVPFHFWLPNAMEAPTPVSAYLHSAAMVKAGIYLLARFSPVLSETVPWTVAVTGLGAVTAVVGAWLALLQSDAKRLLAYSTISALGMMTLALGLGGAHGAEAALAVLFGHALYKGALFMVAGGIDHGAHTRDLTEVRGLARAMPFTAFAAIVAMASMVGLPPTLGFIGEDTLVDTAHRTAGMADGAVLAAVLISGTLYSGAGFVVGLRPMVGRQRAPERPHEPKPSLWLPPLLMAVAGVLLAFVPSTLDRLLLAPATEAVAGHGTEPPLKLWHGVTIPFLLGLGMLVGGAAVGIGWGRLRPAVRRLAALARFGPDRVYQLLDAGLQGTAKRLDRQLQHGFLPAYLIIVALTAFALVGPLLIRAGVELPDRTSDIEYYDVALLALMVAAAAGAVLLRSPLGIIVSMTTVGYVLAIFFAAFGAPDLAITQVLVETLLTVLVVLLLPAMPVRRALSKPASRARDAVVAIGVGGLITALLLTATAAERTAEASTYYLTHSEVDAEGKNVVNSILVSFRAIDTLGEIAVLGAAALGAWTLLAIGKQR